MLSSTFRAGSSESLQKGAMSTAGLLPATGLKDQGACTMFKKIALSTVAAAAALTAMPAAAEAQSRYGYYDNGYYQRHDGRYQRYDRRYNQRYYNRSYGRHYGRRCSSGTTGTIIGATSARAPAR
jgi:hypothetical protein